MVEGVDKSADGLMGGGCYYRRREVDWDFSPAVE